MSAGKGAVLRAWRGVKKTPWGLGLGAACVAGILMWLVGNEGAIGWVQYVLARATSGILNVLGHRTVVADHTVWSRDFGITVIAACTGIFPIGLFLLAVTAYPTRWRSKLVGFGLGIGGITGLNIVRLVSLYYIGVHLPQFLDSAHQLVWQSLLIVLAVTLWLLWAGRWGHASCRS